MGDHASAWPDVQWVWRHQGMSYREMAARFIGGPGEIAMRAHLRKLGFRRSVHRRWVLVPCRTCGAQIEPNDTWLCDGCPSPDRKPANVPEWKRMYDEELARVRARRDAEAERVRNYVRERMNRKLTFKELTEMLAPRDAA